MNEEIIASIKSDIWHEKYAPKSIKECILPTRIKETIVNKIKHNNGVPLIFYGKAGTGKTSTALAICESLNAEVLFVTASTNGSIDMVRTSVQQFASQMSLEGRPKYIIFDEAERISDAAGDGLRNVFNEFSKWCNFIFTVNNINKVSEALLSRSKKIEFNVLDGEAPDLMRQFYERLQYILTQENVSYELDDLKVLIKRYAPDWRGLMVAVQFCSQNEAHRLTILDDMALNKRVADDLVKVINSKNFNEMRKWVGVNSNIDSTSFFKLLFSQLDRFVAPKKTSNAIVIIAQYMQWSKDSIDQEINNIACLSHLLIDDCIKGQ